METVTLYREIGKTLHALGAFRVVLINSKATPGQNVGMSLEIAVEGSINIKEAEKKCLDKFEGVAIKLIDLNDFSNDSVMTEVIEDGIQL